MSESQRASAQTLRGLHHTGRALVLPNAWDAASAAAIEKAGFPAVATTSGGIARTLGFDDHEGAPAGEMLAAAGRIARAVSVPVTADMESGYGLQAGDLAAALGDAGIAGLNIEDTDHSTARIRDSAAQASRIASLRDAARASDVDLVINARIDTFILQEGEPGDRVDLALDRARAYFEAGADCVYPILMSDEADIARFVAAAGGPVNAMSYPGGPTPDRLAALGVARITFGGGLMKAVYDQFRASLEGLRPGD